jgi:hypothetical protein
MKTDSAELYSISILVDLAGQHTQQQGLAGGRRCRACHLCVCAQSVCVCVRARNHQQRARAHKLSRRNLEGH